MKKELAALLSRAEAGRAETSQNAISRLLKLVAPEQVDVADARQALFDLLASSRLAVVSSACQGLTQLLLENQDGGDKHITFSDASDELVKALEIAVARQDQQRHPQGGKGRPSQERGVTQCLTRCLVATSRARLRHDQRRQQPTRGGGGEGTTAVGAGLGLGVTAMLLSLNRGQLYPALAHETTCFVSRFGADRQEVVGVVGPVAAALLLQPEYANLRGGFLLKLSTASASSSDAVKLCLVLLQAELLAFSAVHTPAHADLAAGWCCSLVNTALSLDSDASWDRASRAIGGVAIFLLSEFRERGVPIAPLLGSLQSMVAADPLCLAEEVAFFGITALQSDCIDEREALLDIVGHTLDAMPSRERDDVDVRVQTWSLEALVYPSVSMAAAGNTAAARALPLLEAALDDAYSRATAGMARGTRPEGVGKVTFSKSPRYSSAVALGIRRLGSLEDGNQAVLAACEGLRRRAGELLHENSGVNNAARNAAAVADLECGLCLLAPLLLRPHRQAHSAACAALVAVVRTVPSLGARLLPFVLYATRKLGGAALEDGNVARLLHILPELGAHKFAAKPVAGVVQALAKAPQAAVRGLGQRLAAALVQVNARTFNQLQALLTETPADHVPPLSPEPDESRLCRAAGMLEICEADPELGLECVRPLQAFLGDSSPAVTAVALKAIAALCRGDCLDFDAALRIVTKKGKVAHTGRDSSEEFGDPRVMEGMAQLCGAGAEAAASAAAETAETGSHGSGDDGGMAWGMGSALSILLEQRLGSHPDESVRAAVYTALGAHLPALLQAATGREAEEDAVAAAPQVRAFLGQAMSTDGSMAARPSLQNAASIVLAEESVDPSTWASSKRAGASRARGKEGSERSGPSNRLLAALPSPESVLQAFRQDDSSCPGLAGAVLWCYPAPDVVAAVEHRDTMIRDFGELMAVEGTGGGLALCPWQRAGTPLGIQRYVARLLVAGLAAESAEAERRGEAGSGSGVALAAVESCRKAIASLRGVQAGLVAVASASLASCVPGSFSHVAVEETGRAVERLRSRFTGGAQALLDGEEFFPLCAAMALRALPETSAEQVADAFGEIEHFHHRVGAPTAGGESVPDASTPNEPQTFWSCVAVGVASEWSHRHPTAPGAKAVVLRAARRLLVGLADTIGSEHVSAIAETWCRGSAEGEPRLGRAAVVGWESVDVGRTDSKMGVPTTPWGSRCFGLFSGLSSTLPGLRATGLHLELLQVFNIVRALALRPAAGLCGASICLAAAASECMSCGLIDGPVVLSCLRSVSLSLDASTSPAEGGTQPAQDTCLGAAGLVVACEGKVVLPPGFVESMSESLRKAAVHRRGASSGFRVTSLLALASLVGCALLGPGELVPKRMRVTSIATRRMVETLVQDVLGAMDGTSIRPKNAAARVWGCLSAVGQDERSIGNPGLQEALGWTESGENLGISLVGGGGSGSGSGGGGAAGAITPDALCVAREGTLMSPVLTGLQSAATGLGGVEDGESEKRNQKLLAPVHPSLFAASALACLESCSSALRVPHPQMAVVIEALFRGGHGVEVQKGAVQMALALAHKEKAYSTWLRGLFHKPLLVNLPHDLRRYLVSVVGQVYSKLPSRVGNDLVNELWDTITSRLFVPWSSASVSELEGVAADGSEGIRQATAFLSAMGTLGQDSGIESITMTSLVPSILQAFSARGDVTRFDSDPHEAPLWNALVGLLSRFPWKHVQDAIALKPNGAITGKSSADGFDRAVREYLTIRLAPVGEARSAPPTEVSLHSSAPPAAADAAVATATSRMLGSVVRWGTRVRTKEEASSAVLPRLAERLKPISSTAAGGKWLLMLLDAAELPESCPIRATALVGGATAVWEPWNTGLLVVGEKADELLGRGLCDRSNHRGALFYSMGVTAPRAVVRAEKAAPDLSTEVLARLFRLSGLLHGRIDSATDGRAVAELEEVRCGLECFIRGLRHAPGVLNGTMSRSLASYARSLATGHALS